MLRPASTSAALEHLRRFAHVPIGTVVVTTKEGEQMRGIIMKEVAPKAFRWPAAGITVLDERGSEHQLDLLDVLSVDESEPTDKMKAVLRARGLLQE